MRKYLITGAAGFIGSQLASKLQEAGEDVVGLDNYNDHLYDPSLKEDRVGILTPKNSLDSFSHSVAVKPG